MPKRKLYNPEDSEPYPLSRSRIENFINCPRCFHLEERQGIKAPSGPQFLLNSGIDTLYKNEFDSYRKKKIPHPLMEKNNINAIPFSHKDLDLWRNNFKGIRWFDEKHNFTLFGAVDDLWINEKEEIHIVDYKSTAKKDFSPNFTSGYQVAYKRQLEIYHWLLKKIISKCLILAILYMPMGLQQKMSLMVSLNSNNMYFPFILMIVG